MSIDVRKCNSIDLSSPALAGIAGVNQLLCDRLQYADDEPYAHIYANLAGAASGGKLVVVLAATVIVKDSTGNELLNSAILATPRPVRGLTASATVELSRNGPWHLQVLSERENSVTLRCERTLLFAPVRTDAKAILAALP